MGRSSPTRISMGVYCKIALIAAILFMPGCDTGPTSNLYDPDRDFRPDPVISRIEPSGPALAGVGSLTIIGENFSPTPEENLVYFGESRVNVIEATATQLTVRSPTKPAQDVSVRVTVVGAEGFSNTVAYTLIAAVEEFGGVADFEESFAITTDDEGNVYASLFASNASIGIKRILPDGTRQDYIPSTFKWDGLEFAEDGRVYGVRNVRAIFRFPPGGGQQEVWAVAPAASDRFVAITQGENFIWVGGFGGSIFRADLDGNLEAFPVEGSVRALLELDGFLYAAISADGSSTLVRFPIEDGELGTMETRFSVTDHAGSSVEALSLAATADGAIFIGTDADDPLILVEPDGSGDTFYADLLDPPATSLAWGSGSTLYMSRSDVSGIPSRIVKINTQREGSQ